MNWHAQHDTIHGVTPLNKWSNFRPGVLGFKWHKSPLGPGQTSASMPAVQSCHAHSGEHDCAHNTIFRVMLFRQYFAFCGISAARLSVWPQPKRAGKSFKKSSRTETNLRASPHVCGRATRLHAWHRNWQRVTTTLSRQHYQQPPCLPSAPGPPRQTPQCHSAPASDACMAALQKSSQLM